MVQIAVQDTENYFTRANAPNTIELAFCFDVIENIEPPLIFKGVRGCLDKATVQKIATGMYRIQLHDVFNTVPYAQNTPQPVSLADSKPYNESTMKIQHIQCSLSNWETNTTDVNPSNLYYYVWYWNPEEFPSEMAPANDIIKNCVIVTIFDRTTNLRIDPVTRFRVNLVITMLNTYENALMIPKGVSQ